MPRADLTAVHIRLANYSGVTTDLLSKAVTVRGRFERRAEQDFTNVHPTAEAIVPLPPTLRDRSGNLAVHCARNGEAWRARHSAELGRSGARGSRRARSETL